MADAAALHPLPFEICFRLTRLDGTQVRFTHVTDAAPYRGLTQYQCLTQFLQEIGIDDKYRPQFKVTHCGVIEYTGAEKKLVMTLCSETKKLVGQTEVPPVVVEPIIKIATLQQKHKE